LSIRAFVATPCGQVWQTSNLRRLRLGEERKKIERKIEEETTGQKYNDLPYYIGRPKEIDSQRYVQNVLHWQKHKHASVLAIGQLRHQSATAPSLATHAADAVTAHQCHERDSDVMFTSHVK